MNKTNEKLKKKKSVPPVDLAEGATSSVPSTLVVNPSREEPSGKGKVESSKRKRVDDAGKGVSSPVHAIPLRFEGDLLPLLGLWVEPDCYGPDTSFCLNDLDLRVIRDLGTIGRSKAMTEGIIAAMKSLAVAVVVNNSSTEGASHG